ncbi:hypothetical protein IOD16_11840 [Saccharothrix sp. 6-C]|uniref:hypothetical protein n=1 Tax=Saccharothrix sp. 6-C TaxID=2781735 RepID=UPI0019173B82|nr:hypothetical protein [Saccharothrix sp. 6-C]QQQ79052.1 hypothetical protein IOD16_11840 [Saccharothrix sp. 6-C]
MPFAFGNLGAAGRGDGFSLIAGTAGDDERALSRRMLRARVDFCTTGDPGWTGVRHRGDAVGARREPWRGVDLAVPVDHPVRPPA